MNALTSAYGEDERDFCEVDRCADDACDGDYINNKIYQGSYFNHLENEEELLDQLYTFYPAIHLADTNLSENYTHSTWITSEDNIESDGPLNRKLDYIFSSDPLTNGHTHQGPFYLSDHAPVSAILVLP